MQKIELFKMMKIIFISQISYLIYKNTILFLWGQFGICQQFAVKKISGNIYNNFLCSKRWQKNNNLEKKFYMCSDTFI